MDACKLGDQSVKIETVHIRRPPSSFKPSTESRELRNICAVYKGMLHHHRQGWSMAACWHRPTCVRKVPHGSHMFCWNVHTSQLLLDLPHALLYCTVLYFALLCFTLLFCFFMDILLWLHKERMETVQTMSAISLVDLGLLLLENSLWCSGQLHTCSRWNHHNPVQISPPLWLAAAANKRRPFIFSRLGFLSPTNHSWYINFVRARSLCICSQCNY